MLLDWTEKNIDTSGVFVVGLGLTSGSINTTPEDHEGDKNMPSVRKV